MLIFGLCAVATVAFLYGVILYVAHDHKISQQEMDDYIDRLSKEQ